MPGALDPILGELAHHWFEAAPLGTLPRAIECATLAGHRAFAQLGYEESAGHFERALQASRGGAVDAATRLSLLVVFGQAQQAAGDDEGARATLIEAAQLARDLGDATMFASAVALGRRVRLRDRHGRRDRDRLLEDAIREAGPGDSRRRAFLSAQLSRSLYFADASGASSAAPRRSAVARRLRDDLVLLTALQAAALRALGAGHGRGAAGDRREALALAEDVGHPLGIAEEYAWRILDHLELGDIETVDETMRRYRSWPSAAACRACAGTSRSSRRRSRSWPGRLEEGERLAHRTAQLRQPSVRNNVAPFYGVQLYLLYEEQGRLEGIRPTVDLAAAHATNLPIWRAGRHCSTRRSARRTPRGKSIAPLASRGVRRPAARRQPARHVGAARRGVRAARRAALGGAAPADDRAARRRRGRHRHDGRHLGSAARYAGLLARTRAGWTRRSRYFEKGLAVNARLGALPQLAHTKHDLGGRAPHARARGRRRARRRARRRGGGGCAGARARGARATARRGDDVPQPPSPPPPPEAALVMRAATLRREGDVWTFACGEELTRVKDTKGITYLASSFAIPAASSRRSIWAAPASSGPATRARCSTPRRAARTARGSRASATSSPRPRSSTTSIAPRCCARRWRCSRGSSRARAGSAAVRGRPAPTPSARA
jgi:hypothetical protein